MQSIRLTQIKNKLIEFKIETVLYTGWQNILYKYININMMYNEIENDRTLYGFLFKGKQLSLLLL